MQMNQIKRNIRQATKKQVGRGGTRGKTSGRGHKGQKQHGGHGIRPEIRDFIKKLPKLRGRGVNINKSIQVKPQPVNLKDLEEVFNDGDAINPEILFVKDLVRRQKGKLPVVKILGIGDLKKKLTITGCKVSETALKAIEKAGGSVVKVENRVIAKVKKAPKKDPKPSVGQKETGKKD